MPVPLVSDAEAPLAAAAGRERGAGLVQQQRVVAAAADLEHAEPGVADLGRLPAALLVAESEGPRPTAAPGLALSVHSIDLNNNYLLANFRGLVLGRKKGRNSEEGRKQGITDLNRS